MEDLRYVFWATLTFFHLHINSEDSLCDLLFVGSHVWYHGLVQALLQAVIKRQTNQKDWNFKLYFFIVAQVA